MKEARSFFEFIVTIYDNTFGDRLIKEKGITNAETLTEAIDNIKSYYGREDCIENLYIQFLERDSCYIFNEESPTFDFSGIKIKEEKS